MNDESHPEPTPPGGALSERMASAARDLQRPADPQETYAMATALALSNIDGCEGASLSMVRLNGRRVVNSAATDPAVAQADELQTDLAEGPCLDSIWQQSTTTSPDLAHDPRWPTWGPTVVQRTGYHSVLSFHLFTHGDTLGALNLYSRQLDGFTAEDIYDGLAIAAHVAIAIAGADKLDNLGLALRSRTVIGQATGVLIERFGVKPDVAFAILARVASAEQAKIRVIAEELVRTGHLRGHQRVPETGQN